MNFTLAHITDLHIPSPQNFKSGDRNIKRMLGHLSWQCNRKNKHLPGLLDALKDDLIKVNPDHICITGDLTNLGLDNEFKASAEWVKSLGKNSVDVSIVPGNHDAYGPGYDEKYRHYWAEWMTGINPDADLPFIKETAGAIIIGLNSGVKTYPFSAKGRVSDHQIEALKTGLKAYKGDASKPKVVLIHHPVQDRAANPRKALWERKKLRQALKNIGADLVLHGHTHKIHHDFIDGQDTPIAVLGAGSASFLCDRKGEYGHYQIIEINPDDFTQSKIHHRLYDLGQKAFIENKVIDLFPAHRNPDENIDT